MSRYSTTLAKDPVKGAVHRFGGATKTLVLPLEKSCGALEAIMKSVGTDEPSRVGIEVGEQELPFDFDAAVLFKVHNTHHSTCIEAKKQAHVGLGLTDKKVTKILNKLCSVSWQTVMTKLAEDYHQVGNAYLEVVRNRAGEIKGLHHIPARLVRLFIEDNMGHKSHFVAKGTSLLTNGTGDTRLARFGDLERLREHLSFEPDQKLSEVIHFPQPSSMIRARYYGFPYWLAAAAPVELTQALHQHQFDFHSNRGVPEFLTFLTGGKVDDATWTDLVSAFQSYVGVGNSHKSSIFNLPDPNMKIDIHKLAMDGIANGTFFRDMSETLATIIVSAHRVPPALAGIVLPGKMGAANEVSNAAVVFQGFVIGPEQEHFETILGCTLGDSAEGIKGLNDESFELNTMIHEMAEALKLLNPMDTMGRMDDELGDAAAKGRDLDDGLKKSQTIVLAEALQAAVDREAASTYHG
jgi:hypothetical protein